MRNQADKQSIMDKKQFAVKTGKVHYIAGCMDGRRPRWTIKTTDNLRQVTCRKCLKIIRERALDQAQKGDVPMYLTCPVCGANFILEYKK